MIFNISGRTDIIAFYYPWLVNRLNAGYVDVRHPFDEHLILRYALSPQLVEALTLCTKNPMPILKNPEPLLRYCTIIHVTLTPYGADLEPNVPKKMQIIQSIKELSKIFGKDHIYVRYDPIVLTEKHTIKQHLSSFENMVRQLKDDVYAFVISFVDDYRNTSKHHIHICTQEEMITLGKGIGAISKKYGVIVQSCSEPLDLSAYGIKNGLCLDPEVLTRLTGLDIDWVKEKGKREHCACADYRDIGAYNSCLHLCKYCYANFDESKIIANYQQHDPKSSLLIGKIEPGDRVKEVKFKARQVKLF